ncbi:hypothetical protein V8F20_011035 [Naviculisporaceae sp. PSN 640]
MVSTALSIISVTGCFIGQAVASPLEHEATKVAARIRNVLTAVSWPTASGGALDPSPSFTVNPAQISEGPDIMTLEVVNSAGYGLSTTHDRNKDTPAPSGDPKSGVLPAGSTDRLQIPRGWAGKIAINKQGYAIGEDESLIEGSFDPQDTAPDPDVAIVAINVSFVAGFSLPIVCTCPLEGNKYLSGCWENLWTLNTCPSEDYNGQGSCKNPNRNSSELEAADFFQPCQGLAYTFPKDSQALSNGECQSGTIRCTIYPGL